MRFKFLTNELLNKLQCDVYDFRRAYGLNVGGIINPTDCELHTSLIVEEVMELAQADSEVDRIDAIVDSVYVLIGRYVHKCGLYTDINLNQHGILYMVDVLLQVANNSNYDFHACWDEIHSSNMSKMCNDLDEVEATMDYYAERGISTTCEPVGNHYAIKCDIDQSGLTKRGKTLKSINYKPADLADMLYKSDL